MSDILSVNKLVIKDGQHMEDLVVQLQHLTNYVLCVEDGTTLKVFPAGTPYQGVLESTRKTDYGAIVSYRHSSENLLAFFIPHSTPATIDVKMPVVAAITATPPAVSEPTAAKKANDPPESKRPKPKPVVLDDELLKKLQEDNDSEDELPKPITITKNAGADTILNVIKD